MKFDDSMVDKLDSKEERNLLLKGGIIFDIISVITLIIGIVLLILGYGLFSIPFFVITIVLIIIGIKNLFLKGDSKKKYLTAKLVEETIKKEKNNGKNLSIEEIDRFKFKYDPLFHDKVVAQVHREQDDKYETNVKKAELKVKKLEQDRVNEIERINNERWQSVANGNLKYNLVEGKINVNQTIHLFSSIKGAEVNKEDSYRIVTTETGKSKKHASLGGAVAGSLILGPVGAVVGGTALGKTTSKGNSVSNSIPTCNHIGVMIDIDGFKSEVILLNNTVDQSSNTYKTALQYAEEIVSKLHYLATQPVPKTFIKVEEEQSVLDINKTIAEAEKELKNTKDDKPKYEIPEKYL